MNRFRPDLARLRWRAAFAAALVCLMPFAAQAEYLLDSGDVVKVSIFGVQDFDGQTAVNIDGNLSLPLLGEVPAAGRSLAALRNHLQSLLPANEIVRGTDVTVVLVEYRPFYISGNVAKPGAHPYHPGITVRHALALAGGYSSSVTAGENSLFTAVDLRSQYEALLLQFSKQHARVKSLQIEMDGDDPSKIQSAADPSAIPEISIDPQAYAGNAAAAQQAIGQIVELESQRLKARLAGHQKLTEHLRQAIKHAESQRDLLAQGQRQTEIELNREAAELSRLAALNDKGVVSTARLAEEQRLVSQLKNQQIDARKEIDSAQQNRLDLIRQIEKENDDRRTSLLQELQDAVVDLQTTRAELKAVNDKIFYTLAGRSQAAGDRRDEFEFAVYRKVDGKQVRVSATQDSDVQPGDVVEVLLRPREPIAAQLD